jgi:hypothetical protein
MERNNRLRITDFLDALETYFKPADGSNQSFLEMLKSKAFWIRVGIAVVTVVGTAITIYATGGTVSPWAVLQAALPILKGILDILGPMPRIREIRNRLREGLNEEIERSESEMC